MKIHFDELDFKTSPLYEYGAFYKNQLFTGIAYEEEDNEYYEFNYRNGNADGRWYGINQKTQQLIYDKYYRDGSPQEIKVWNEDGELLEYEKYDHHGNLIFQKKFNEQGILVVFIDKENEIDEEYYDNGSLYRKTSYQNQTYQNTYFLDKDKWLMKETGYLETNENGLTYKIGRKRDNYEFNIDLFCQEIPQLKAQFHARLIGPFIQYLQKTDKQRALECLAELAKHKEPWFRGEAADYLGRFRSPKSISILNTLRHDCEKPFIRNRFEFGGSGHALTIGERATRSLLQQTQPKS
jgi:hypothetical protein